VRGRVSRSRTCIILTRQVDGSQALRRRCGVAALRCHCGVVAASLRRRGVVAASRRRCVKLTDHNRGRLRGVKSTVENRTGRRRGFSNWRRVAVARHAPLWSAPADSKSCLSLFARDIAVHSDLAMCSVMFVPCSWPSLLGQRNLERARRGCNLQNRQQSVITRPGTLACTHPQRSCGTGRISAFRQKRTEHWGQDTLLPRRSTLRNLIAGFLFISNLFAPNNVGFAEVMAGHSAWALEAEPAEHGDNTRGSFDKQLGYELHKT
jgi:hypothetical protein